MLWHSCPMDMPMGNSCTTFDPFRPDIYRHSMRFVPMHPPMGHNIPGTQVCMFPCQLTPHMFPPHTCHRCWLNHSSLCVPFWHTPWHRFPHRSHSRLIHMYPPHIVSGNLLQPSYLSRCSHDSSCRMFHRSCRLHRLRHRRYCHHSNNMLHLTCHTIYRLCIHYPPPLVSRLFHHLCYNTPR